MLYEVALIQQPTHKERENGVQEVLILPPTPVIAKDDQAAAVAAVMQHKDKIGCDMGRVDVIVRPFGRPNA